MYVFESLDELLRLQRSAAEVSAGGSPYSLFSSVSKLVYDEVHLNQRNEASDE